MKWSSQRVSSYQRDARKRSTSGQGRAFGRSLALESLEDRLLLSVITFDPDGPGPEPRFRPWFLDASAYLPAVSGDL